MFPDAIRWLTDIGKDATNQFSVNPRLWTLSQITLARWCRDELDQHIRSMQTLLKRVDNAIDEATETKRAA